MRTALGLTGWRTVALSIAPLLAACSEPKDAGDNADTPAVLLDGASSRDDDAGQDGGPSADADDDSVPDALEIACGTDPHDPLSAPADNVLLGDGTSVSPFVICLPGHLDLLALHPDVTTAQAEITWDLDFAGRVPPLPLGTATTPFAGMLSGHGHRLMHLDFSLSTSAQAGLVEAVAATGVVEDLRIEASNGAVGTLLVGRNAGMLRRVTVAGDTSGMDHVGLLVNVNATSGVIEDCHALGSLSATKSHIGGLVGENLGSVRDSSSAAQVSGENRTGGLVGTNSGSIERSFATGAVRGAKDFVGGLIGTVRNGGTVGDCYALGEVRSGSAAGGLVGSVQLGGTLERCYARNTVIAPMAQGLLGIDEDMSATVTSCYFDETLTPGDALATGLGSSDVLLQTSYAGFDFSENTGVWKMVLDQDSPSLVRP